MNDRERRVCPNCHGARREGHGEACGRCGGAGTLPPIPVRTLVQIAEEAAAEAARARMTGHGVTLTPSDLETLLAALQPPERDERGLLGSGDERSVKARTCPLCGEEVLTVRDGRKWWPVQHGCKPDLLERERALRRELDSLRSTPPEPRDPDGYVRRRDLKPDGTVYPRTVIEQSDLEGEDMVPFFGCEPDAPPPQLDRKIWRAGVGDPAAKLLLLAIAHQAAEGTTDPTTADLCRMTGMSRATLFRRLNNLEDRGFIARIPRFDRDGRQRSSAIHLKGDADGVA